MKNYKVQAIRNFRDSNEIDEKTGLKIERTINDEFYCTKERYEFLKQNNAVKLVEIEEEKQEPIIFVDTKDESEDIKPIDEENMKKVADAILKNVKPKRKKTSKK